MAHAPRSEAEIFSELEQLCGSPGYIHVYAALVVKNTFVRFAEKIKGEDFHESFGKEHLIRTELSTLLGMMVKHKIDFTALTQEQISQLGTPTLHLLEELHASLSGPMRMPHEMASVENFRDLNFARGAVLREPIFYTGESAYASQYRDFAPLKYRADEQWIQSNRGFTIAQAAKVGRAILALQQDHLGELYNGLRSGVPENFTFLPGFSFTAQNLLEPTGESESTIVNVLNAFTIADADRNHTFRALNDFNLANAQPIIRGESDTYILFQAYGFYEALYESPFYWMLQDASYKDTAFKHRGEFTEEFAAQRLARVFGKKHTYTNVIIEENTATTAGEIDSLVLFGNRAIVVQAKSKRLTLEARKGNDGAIQKDFTASIADSYQQALDCAQHLLHRDRRFVDKNGTSIAIPKLKKVYLLCLVSDHYPALSFQVGEFLTPVISSEIPAPFVTDVFTLDVMTEMLDSPLHLLSYIDRRTGYGDRIFAGHELTILGYHLTSNLWLSSTTDVIYLIDDVSSSLDAAIAVRRDGVPGERTPHGILTITKGSGYDRLISQIDNDPRGDLVDLGFMLLQMSGESASQLSQGVEYATRRARETHGPHDITMGSGKDTGITIHSSYLPIPEGIQRLEGHVLSKKYQQKAPSWFGIGIHPDDESLLFGYNAEFKWEKNDALEEASRSLSNGLGIEFVDGKPRKRKVGRNDPCPCGSGKKYKKCHLND
jgi:SEC-C motif